MKKSTKSKPQRQPRTRRSKRAQSTNPQDAVRPFHGQLRELLLDEIRGAVARTAEQLVQEEVLELVGAPWSRKGENSLRRGGSCRTRIFLDGEPVHLTRTRVRDLATETEHPLRTIKALASRDALDEDVRRLLVRGVSTRNYEPALGTIADGLGLKKSAVSSAFQRASQKDLDSLNGRSLGEWRFVAVYIDGVGFGDTTCIVAMGVTDGGEKKILGVIEGATENATVVSDLLANLEERGLELTHRALFVLDGSKALRRAVKNTFGKRAVIQRCVLHKQRNILSYLPPSKHAEARRRLRAAWGMADYDAAKKELGKVQAWLKKISPSAAGSLEEALDDTLAVHRLGVTDTLRRTLITTNPIESSFDVVRSLSRRVKRWTGPAMVLRWIGTGLVRAEEQFRRVKGHKAIPALVSALENTDLQDSKIVA